MFPSQHLTAFVLALLTATISAKTANETTTQGQSPFICRPLQGSRSCSNFYAYTIPGSVFSSTTEFDTYIVDETKRWFGYYSQNCSNRNQLDYVQGTTTQVCYRTLMRYWRPFQCGLGGVGGDPPRLCSPDCRRFVMELNGKIRQCLPLDGTVPPERLDPDVWCGDAIEDTTKCITGDATSTRLISDTQGQQMMTMGALAMAICFISWL